MFEEKYFDKSTLKELLTTRDKALVEGLHKKARELTFEQFANKIYIRGLIEYSNYCKEGCYYCGINRANKNVERFRLTEEEILQAAKKGHAMGFRTFVLQGGEDPYFTDDLFESLIRKLKILYPDTAITLSFGVRPFASYKRLKEAGADRFLLRFESSNPQVFSRLHPKDQTLDRRVEAIKDLKKLRYTTGTGFLVMPPYADIEDHIRDIELIRQLEPEMIGIGPFIPQKDTIFKGYHKDSFDLTLRLISILRIENPRALIPSTTALNTLNEKGRILGIMAGANVLMPNLSPDRAKGNYKLYDNKEKSGLESANGLDDLRKLLAGYGYEIEIGRGDYKDATSK